MRALLFLTVAACVVLLVAWQFVGMVFEYEQAAREQSQAIEQGLQRLGGGPVAPAETVESVSGGRFN